MWKLDIKEQQLNNKKHGLQIISLNNKNLQRTMTTTITKHTPILYEK